MPDMVSISIVSHAQMSLVVQLLADLRDHCSGMNLEVLVTRNVPETCDFDLQQFPYPIHVTENTAPVGFGANHNAAFLVARGEFFCVLNPDIRLLDNPFPALVNTGSQNGVGVVAPAILSSGKGREDSARNFPSPLELVGKVFGCNSSFSIGIEDILECDWIAGMFMLFPRKVFEEMNGFDERYFLYYEDVDLCARLALAGYKRLVCQDVSVIHDARRTSHRNLRYALWHLRSIIRFFCSEPYRRLKRGHCASL